MPMIPFNTHCYTGREDAYVLAAMRGQKLSGDGEFGLRCHAWFEKNLSCHKALLTPSCTHALEMAALLIDVQPGDEIIMPSYTFVSSANAFVLRGARVVFVDIRADTLNINEQLIAAAITPKTKAIVVVHYAGVACEMSRIMALAQAHGVWVIEDAAHGMMAAYQQKPLGSIGHLGAFSFHDTKNYTSAGEGGLLIINDERFVERAEIIREKGTNRRQFLNGQVNKYSWMDVGSSFMPSDIQAAYLWAQLERAESINQQRLQSWQHYADALQGLAQRGCITLPCVPEGCQHNASMFYIKCANARERTALMQHLKNHQVQSAFHYVPLHSSPAGLVHGRFHGEDIFTTAESERLLRLPLWYGLSAADIDAVVAAVNSFYA